MSEVRSKREGGNRGVSRPLLQWVLLSLCGVVLAAAPAAGQPIVLEAMKAELERSMAVLGEKEVPPYFLSYEITETDTVSVGAMLPSFLSGAFSALGLGQVVSVPVPDLLFEELSLRRPSCNAPHLPVAAHPYFDQ